MSGIYVLDHASRAIIARPRREAVLERPSVATGKIALRLRLANH